MTINNKFEVIFDVIQTGKNEQGLQGSFETLGVGNKSVQSDFLIHPRNKFQVKFDVAPPPRIIKILDAVQDVFVYEGNKSYNYGLWSYLQIGVDSEGLVSRSFIDFDFSTFPSNVHITKATLVLYSKTRNAFEGLELSTSNKEYDETDIVWGNQPIREQFISVNNIDNGTFVYKLDVTNTVRDVWYAQNLNNHGFLLKSYDETVQQQIQFFSKESISYIPKLEIEYFDMDIYKVGAGAIKGDLEVIVPTHDEGLSGDFIIDKIKDTTNLVSSFQLINNDMLQGDLFVPNKKDIHGNFKLWKATHISGDFILDGKPVYYPELNGDFLAVHYDPNFNMYYEHIKAKFEVAESTWLRSDFYIAQSNQINAELLVINQKSLINGSFNVVHINDLSCDIGNIEELNRTEVNGSFEVIGSSYKGISGSFEAWHVKDINCSFYIANNNQINGSLEVPRKKDLQGNLEVKNATTISGDLTVIVDAKIKGQLKVVIPAVEEGIRASFQAIAQTCVHGDIDVKQDRLFGEFTVIAQNSILGDFFIPEKKDIKGNFVVWKSTYVQGNFNTIALGFSDLFCGFYLDGRIPVIKSYGFIM